MNNSKTLVTQCTRLHYQRYPQLQSRVDLRPVQTLLLLDNYSHLEDLCAKTCRRYNMSEGVASGSYSGNEMNEGLVFDKEEGEDILEALARDII